MEAILAQTQRLILRRFRDEDFDDLYAYVSDPEVVRFEPYKPMSAAETKENLAWRITSGEMIAVELKETHKMIGNIYLGKREFDALELGYVFNRNYWGHGYAQESCRAAVELSFRNGTHRIFAECDPLNRSSWKLLETLGFSREAHLLQNVYFWKDEAGNPLWKDTFVYSLLNGGRKDTGLFDSEFCRVEYLAGENLVYLCWKKRATFEDYRAPTSFALEQMRVRGAKSFIIDARNGFEDEKEDVEWGFSYLLPEMAKAGCRTVVMIMNGAVSIEAEMDMWTKEFSRYFKVLHMSTLSDALRLCTH